MRLFAISDLHVDHSENMNWLEQLSAYDYRQDVLILAGDVADQTTLFARAMNQLSDRFHQVLYVPGNHDLWTLRTGGQSSFEKLRIVQEVCRDANVSMAPYRSGASLIVPLSGWYDYSFGSPSEKLRAVWMDFRGCNWEGLDDLEVSQILDETNVTPAADGVRTIISFSHFLPRMDLISAALPEKYRFLFPVLGSEKLERRLRALGSQMHVSGHSHRNHNVVRDGVTYINNAFGYPSERHIAAKALLHIGDL